jgi:hypothetical protein
MMYPLTIIDNFFPNPDKIVEFANKQRYYPTDGAWPGSRSRDLDELDEDLHGFIGHKILSYYYTIEHDSDKVLDWNIEMRFQKIKPLSDDQYDVKNLGWIHRDSHCLFAGIIYLNKESEKDTGTSFYSPIKGYDFCYPEPELEKRKLYVGKPVAENFSVLYKKQNDQYKETVKVENEYNRLVMFDSSIPHSIKTLGTQERLTLVFFVHNIFSEHRPPGFRATR